MRHVLRDLVLVAAIVVITAAALLAYGARNPCRGLPKPPGRVSCDLSDDPQFGQLYVWSSH